MVHRRDPRKDAREFPVYPGYVAQGIDPRAAERDQALRAHDAHNVRAASAPTRSAWWEDPIALGSLLILLPPMGLAAVWSSKRYSSDARWALTVMTALTMCLMTAVLMATLTLR